MVCGVWRRAGHETMEPALAPHATAAMIDHVGQP